MDKISFTGIKNVSHFAESFLNYNDVFTEERWLSAELTGRDLHKFQRAMKRSNMDKRNYTNPVRDNFININKEIVDPCFYNKAHYRPDN